MPTASEQQELLNTDNCNWQWTKEDGVYGYKVTSKKNGNSIFLPAAGDREGTSLYNAGSYGHYWNSSPYLVHSDWVYNLYFVSNDSYRTYSHRVNGFTVRPVSE